jgi:hypothetical protein
MPREILSVHHFIQCARRGRSGAASSGERICRLLAENLAEIGDDIALLDPEALNGYLELCKLAAGPWQTDAEKDIAFSLIQSAGS